ncbi:fasciclin domain-containing protein [Bacteroidales bacterium OttesenSCG-928-M11]|nr:fasciclin domain-containing protein [Bacteroidales bacterium OttesenSCG-928-M11]
MKKKKTIRCVLFMFLFALSGFYFVSCEDPYIYNNEEPKWLGSSIYDHLNESKDRTYTYFLDIINSVEDDGIKYSDVLKRTGSKTLFVADDAAFEAFFKDNEYGITKFSDFSASMKRMILFSSMLNDTYLLEMLSNISGTPPTPGYVLRKTNSISVLDSLPYLHGHELPKTKYWTRFEEKGIYLLKDNTSPTTVYFMDKLMTTRNITNEDFEIISGYTRQAGDNFLYNIKIVEGDIACKNGYIHVLEKVLIPPSNMAQYIRENDETSLFSSFLDRYCAPIYDGTSTLNYRVLHPEFSDSIFTLAYFNSHSVHSKIVDPDGGSVSGLLSFDPGWNAFQTDNSSTALQTDMAALFVPTNEALDHYFNEGEGVFIKERYGSWENIPNNVLNMLINNHMKPSFIGSLPSKFDALEDKMGTPMGITKEDVKYAKVCNNGVVYVVDGVFPPTEYISVMSPVIFSDYTKVFNWAQIKLQFELYLLSMENKFSYLVPTDEEFSNYISPVSIASKATPERWDFYFNEEKNLVYATVYDAVTGDSLRTEGSSQSNLQNYLRDIVDNHIVVGDIEDGKRFYQTKGGATVKINGTGVGMSVKGGGNIEYGEDVRVTSRYEMQNGKTYFLDAALQTANKSVYQVMSENQDLYGEFFNLCIESQTYEYGGKTYGGSIFYNDKSNVGITENVSFFNTFNYTVYVPTNKAIQDAIASGVIKQWSDMNNYEGQERANEVQKLYDFLRYHFQDNSIYISGEKIDRSCETAAINSATNKFRKLQVKGNGENLTLKTEAGKEVNVITSTANVMSRDYKFNGADIKRVTQISTSSFAVIHQVNDILTFN